jgi:hypothetical protein
MKAALQQETGDRGRVTADPLRELAPIEVQIGLMEATNDQLQLELLHRAMDRADTGLAHARATVATLEAKQARRRAELNTLAARIAAQQAEAAREVAS